MKKTIAIFSLILITSIIGMVGAYSDLSDYYNSIDYSCTQDSDCEIKDVGNCCGYYPKCINKNTIVNSTFVSEECEKEELVGACGFPAINVCKCENNICVGHENESAAPGCKSLYWIDNENKECGQKQFCGVYMYQGLFTFENETECQNYVLASSGDNINDPGCKSLYWIDNENKECGQKQFCGAYMYYGLQTFESKVACEKVTGINKTNCPSNSGVENGKCIFNLSNGIKAEVKIMPETASQIAIEKLGDLGFTIELKEVGKGEETKAVYELTGNKQGKFLGIFKIMARVQAQVDAENGDVKVIKPWWSFLASGV